MSKGGHEMNESKLAERKILAQQDEPDHLDRIVALL
jgi:hypothetical protein